MSERTALRVLLVDDDETFCRVFGGALAEDGFRVESATDGLLGLERMNQQAFDIALVDLRMPRMDGLSLLAELRRRHPATIPVVLTGHGSVTNAVESMRAGAFDVVSKTASVDQVAATLRKAADQRRRSRAGTPLEETVFEREAFFNIVGRSPAIQKVIESIRRFKDVGQPVLVSGESGTGKELVVRALHAAGSRRHGPLIAVNCASLRENFVESELFGHVRGAFTGAIAAKKGLFALADGGTLHIDEIGEMPESAQAALLRVLDSGAFRPLGATDEIRADTRVVAATNRNLEEEVAAGRFRGDLFFRLNVCRIDVPPLRERREDIPLLVNHFLDSSTNAQRVGARITRAAIERLMSYQWPGNVREILNVLERAVLLAPNGEVGPERLGLPDGPPPPPDRAPRNQQAESPPTRSPPQTNGTFAQLERFEEYPTLEGLERSYVETLLKRTGGNITEASRILQIDPTTLRRKLRRWQSETPDDPSAC